jgi:HAD superfamily hydrolase (TIGR01509 family)
LCFQKSEKNYFRAKANKLMQLPHPVQAIIFDLDGTLVDSETVHCYAWLKILANRGYHYDEHWFEQWIGTADRFLAADVIAEHKLTIHPLELQLEKEALFHDLVQQKNRAYPGIEKALAILQKRIPLAIATNSSSLDAEKIFISTPLDRYMQTVVTSSDVKKLKPAPDMYLLAAERLGVSPRACLVVEDSPAGSQAAQKAGMYVLGLTSSQPKDKMTAAQEWFAQPAEAMQRLLALLD